MRVIVVVRVIVIVRVLVRGVGGQRLLVRILREVIVLMWRVLAEHGAVLRA
jgi:hypothetical protein